MPQTTLTRLDLPAPFSPTRMWTSPSRTSRSTWSMATTPGKCLVRPWSSRMLGIIRLPGRPPSRRTVFLEGGLPGSLSSWGCPLFQVGGGDQLDWGLDPALEVFAIDLAEASLDAVLGHIGAELVDGGQDLALLDEVLYRRDVVEADDVDLAGEAGGVDGLNYAQRHGIVG